MPIRRALTHATPPYLLVVAILTLAGAPPVAGGAGSHVYTRARVPPKVTLTASFSPKVLGRGTTVSVGFTVRYGTGEQPLPVTEVRLAYPAGLGIGTSELGLQTCDPAALQAIGPRGCPGNSLMGHGRASVKVPFGPREVGESAPITIFSQPLSESHIGLLFSVSGDFPVIANLAFGAFVLPGGGRYGGMIDTTLPLVPSVPGGADVALVGLSTTIGPKGITYSERVGKKTVRFTPEGFLLPGKCPRKGFPFAARVSFVNNTSATAKTTVACPRSSAGRHG